METSAKASTAQGLISSAFERSLPLVVDLDGTLIRSDLLVESAFGLLGEQPALGLRFPGWLLGGKATLKAEIASRHEVDVAVLPYEPAVVELMQQARAQGRDVYIASASNQKYVRAVAAHLQVTGWFASDEAVNLSGSRKAKRLVDEFGAGGFDYAGNDLPDLPVWEVSRQGYAVNVSPSLRRRLATGPVKLLPTQSASWRAWLKLMRVHQWTKNLLVFVPLLASHQLGMQTFLASMMALLAFSLAASSIYIINDLADLSSDRRHPTKCRRPLAAGRVPILGALVLAFALFGASLMAAGVLGWPFVAVLLVYLATTTAYTFWLKRKMLIDVITLAGLYSVRVLAGAVAINVPVSEWLIGFSVFIFTSMALIKRYTELTARIDKELPDPSNRNYKKQDLPVLSAMAAAAGFNAVTVLALYISSPNVRLLYSHPQWLWLICPVIMYWIGRALMLAHRRLMNDDPILFALRDRNSLLAAAAIGLLGFLAR